MQPFTLTAVTLNDVRTGDRDRYLQLVALLEAELQPEGALEVLHAAEIVRANWRLQIYAHLEGSADSEAARISLDRARSHTNTIVRRNTAELRRLQTDRLAGTQLNLDLPRTVSLRDYLQLTKNQPPRRPDAENEPQTEKRKNEPNPAPADVAHMETLILRHILQEEQGQLPKEMKKQTQSQPRNEQCGCGSGLKFKRCCGHWSKAA